MYVLREDQKKLTDEILESVKKGPTLGVASTGFGKCHSPNTFVLMADGTQRKIKDVCVGDLLMGDDSTPRKVLDTVSGQDQMYRIDPVKGDSWVCNSQHELVLVANAEKFSVAGVKAKKNQVFEIPLKEYFKLTKTAKHCLKQFRVAVTHFETEKKELLLPAYSLGVWLGDGHKRADKGMTLSLNDYNKAEVGQRVAEEVLPLGLVSHCSLVREHRGKGVRQRTKKGYLWTEKIAKIYGKHPSTHELWIPHEYKTASIEVRLALIAGLLDADGDFKKQFSFSTVSKQLAEDMVFLCRSVGLAAYNKARTTKCEGKIFNSFRVNISGDLDRIPTLRFDQKERRQIKSVLRTGFTVTALGLGDYCGVMVDGNHRYLLADFTVTHNSVCIAKMARHYVEQGKSFHIWVHRNLLVKQLVKTLEYEGIKPGVIQGQRKISFDLVQIISVQTLARRDPRNMPKPYAVLVDESHRVSADNTYNDLIELYNPTHFMGLTATPCRSDGKGLGDLFDYMVEGPPAKVLIERGSLSPFKMLGCKSGLTDLNVKKRKKEYLVSDILDQLDTGEFNGELVRDYKKHIPDKTVIVFCMNKAHAEDVCAKYNGSGVPALTLLDHHKEKERDEIVYKFEQRMIKALIVVGIPIEGFDVKGCDAVQIAYKTCSIMKWLQSIGRALRTAPGKDMAYILDHSDNHLRLPWPTSNIQWSLTESPLVLDDEVQIKDKETQEVIIKELKELEITELGTDLEVIGLEDIIGLQLEQRRNEILTSFELHLETATIRGHKPISAYYKTLEQYNKELDLETLKAIAKKLGYDFRWANHALKILEKDLEF